MHVAGYDNLVIAWKITSEMLFLNNCENTTTQQHMILSMFSGRWGVCCFLVVLLMTGQMATSYNLVGITAVRYLMVKEPLKCHIILTSKRMRIGCTAVWTFALTVAVALYARSEPSRFWVFYCNRNSMYCFENWHVTLQVVIIMFVERNYSGDWQISFSLLL